MKRRALVLVLLVACGKSSQNAPQSESASTTATPLTPPAMTESPTTIPSADAGPVGLVEKDPPPADGGTRSTAYEKASEAMLQGRSAEVRQLLETKVRSGRASVDEARLVRAACKRMGDKPCRDDIDSKYPSLKPPQ